MSEQVTVFWRLGRKWLDFWFKRGIFFQRWKLEKSWKKPEYVHGNTFKELDFGKLSVFFGRVKNQC